MRKSEFCICENKQRLCFRYTDSKSLFFLNPKFQASCHLCDCTARFVSDLVGNPEDGFSHKEAQINKDLKTLGLETLEI